jgi:hypothetical protein
MILMKTLPLGVRMVVDEETLHVSSGAAAQQNSLVSKE